MWDLPYDDSTNKNMKTQQEQLLCSFFYLSGVITVGECVWVSLQVCVCVCLSVSVCGPPSIQCCPPVCSGFDIWPETGCPWAQGGWPSGLSAGRRGRRRDSPARWQGRLWSLDKQGQELQSLISSRWTVCGAEMKDRGHPGAFIRHGGSTETLLSCIRGIVGSSIQTKSQDIFGTTAFILTSTPWVSKILSFTT